MSHDLQVGHQSKCQICESGNLELVIDLGFHAPCDSLLTAAQLNEPELRYPLRFCRCLDCGLAQIDYVVHPRVLFPPEYPYRSGITETLANNLTGLAAKYPDGKHRLVVDIGSNDGTVLRGFEAQGWNGIGVEPTQIGKIANNAGILTLNAFFTHGLALNMVSEFRKASIITAANVFAHVNNLGDFMRGVDALLEDDGLFITESHYLPDMLETVQYDAIYHEHLRYYTINPLLQLLNAHGFTVIEAVKIPNYGGSIRMTAQRSNRAAPVKVISGIQPSGWGYSKFVKRMRTHRDDLTRFMERRQIPGIGCPGRASTLLQWCGMSTDQMPYIAEQSTSLKLGLYTPGTHIPVVDEARLFEEQPEYALLLSWHYAEPIVKSLRARGLKSKIIVPLPELRIV